MTTKERIHALVEALDDSRLDELADYIEWLSEPDELSPAAKLRVEEGEAELARGEFVSLAELRAKYDE